MFPENSSIKKDKSIHSMTIDHYIPIEGNEEYTESYVAYDEFSTQQDANNFGIWIQNPDNYPEGANRLLPISQQATNPPSYEPEEEGEYFIALWMLGGPHIFRIYYIPGLGSPIIIP